MKTITICILLLCLLSAGCSSEPIYAKVQTGSETLVIKNGNDNAWIDAYITINGAFSGYCLTVSGSWPAGETKTLNLSDFHSILKKTQAFKPEFEKVTEVTIRVAGLDPGIYK